MAVCDASLYGPNKEDTILNESGYFEFEAGNFNSSLAKKTYKRYTAKKCYNKAKLKAKFKEAFSKTTPSSVNLVYLAGHGSKNGSY